MQLVFKTFLVGGGLLRILVCQVWWLSETTLDWWDGWANLIGEEGEGAMIASTTVMGERWPCPVECKYIWSTYSRLFSTLNVFLSVSVFLFIFSFVSLFSYFLVPGLPSLQLRYCFLVSRTRLHCFIFSFIYQLLRATAYMLSAHMLSQFRPSVRPSVCLSHGWFMQKRL